MPVPILRKSEGKPHLLAQAHSPSQMVLQVLQLRQLYMENWGSSGPCVSGFSLLFFVDRNCAGRQFPGICLLFFISFLLSLKAILASKNLSLTTSQLLPHDLNLIDTSALALSHGLKPQ